MDELRKISRIVHQQAEGCALEVLLALDATTGQNAVNQASQFNEVADITGIILTKLDGTAKGGIIISITDDLKIPVKLVGVGEKLDDLQPFSSHDFVEALFSSDDSFEGNYERKIDEETEEELEESEQEELQSDEHVAEESNEIIDEQDVIEDSADESEQLVEENEQVIDETEEQETAKKSRFGFRFPFGKKKKGE